MGIVLGAVPKNQKTKNKPSKYSCQLRDDISLSFLTLHEAYTLGGERLRTQETLISNTVIL